VPIEEGEEINILSNTNEASLILKSPHINRQVGKL
jgi:hypothetical protein